MQKLFATQEKMITTSTSLFFVNKTPVIEEKHSVFKEKRYAEKKIYLIVKKKCLGAEERRLIIKKRYSAIEEKRFVI